jgi:Mn-dependent DtxR family transcriptional regulator
VLLHVSLHIPSVQNDPWRLGRELGVSNDKITEILKKLRDSGFISLNDRHQVTGIENASIHYGPEHPFMRAHQALFRQFINARILQTAENDKTSMMVTFTADESTHLRVKAKFQEFLKWVESTCSASVDQHTYQMQFDLFKWF